MTSSHIDELLTQLSERDLAVLSDIERFRLLRTRQIQRLHFDPAHPTPMAAARGCTRALARLRDCGVVRTLERRIGGRRAGSTGSVWFVGPAGERVLRVLTPTKKSARSNYGEPSRHFVEHTLAVAEVAVQVIEADRRGQFELIQLQTEPTSWEQSLSPFGTIQWLKPDLHLITASGDYEQHWFIEVDLATEHVPVILRQCQAYERFRAVGAYQARHGLFPAVLWVVPTEARMTALRAAVAHKAGLSANLFQFTTASNCISVLAGRLPEGA